MKKNNIFWISYSDLLTSLFFVMLVLFIIAVGYLKNQMEDNEEIIENNKTLIEELEKSKAELEVELEEKEKLLKIEEQFKPLEESGRFQYLPDCKKYVVKDFIGKEIFNPKRSEIKPKFVNTTIEVGRQIETFLETLKTQNPEMSYMLVIEGNVANRYDKSFSQDNKRGYNLSYERALAVYDLWRKNNINLREKNTEILICGSGFNGLCRDEIEENNKRFSIQIIPKVENRSK